MAGDFLIGFSHYLSNIWLSGFEHRYSVTRHPSWSRWREICGVGNAEVWHCNSLSQAAEHYSWTGPDAAAEFQKLSSQLQAAVQGGDECIAHDLCLDIFKWGGVGRRSDDKSVLWLRERLHSKSLCVDLQDGRDLLMDLRAELHRFDGMDLLMNSALTKVYAALVPSRLVIYDGRVGAALGLIARDYLHSINHQGLVPHDLAFPWGASQGQYVPGHQNKRDPSDNRFQFPALFGAHRDKLHAEMMRSTSYLLGLVDRDISGESGSNLPRLEQALFMIGYDVSRSLVVPDSLRSLSAKGK